MSLFNFRNISRLFNEHLRQMISFSKNKKDIYPQDENNEENDAEDQDFNYKNIMCKVHAAKKRVIDIAVESISLLLNKLDKKYLSFPTKNLTRIHFFSLYK